jgi:hypothetical protein
MLRKAKESLGPVYSKNSSFKRELHELLDQTVCAEEFEKKWADVIARYSLADNDFLTRAYENREMWAKPFFTETFCAGMTSTQRSESANHVLKKYIPRSAPMHLFVTQYDRLVTDRVAEEGREQHATKQVCVFQDWMFFLTNVDISCVIRKPHHEDALDIFMPNFHCRLISSYEPVCQ